MQTPAKTRGSVPPSPETPGRGAIVSCWLALLVLIACWDLAGRLDESGTRAAPSPDRVGTAARLAQGHGAVVREASR